MVPGNLPSQLEILSTGQTYYETSDKLTGQSCVVLASDVRVHIVADWVCHVHYCIYMTQLYQKPEG